MLYAFFRVISWCQTPGKYPEESIQHSEHGERLKSMICILVSYLFCQTWASLWQICGGCRWADKEWTSRKHEEHWQ